MARAGVNAVGRVAHVLCGGEPEFIREGEGGKVRRRHMIMIGKRFFGVWLLIMLLWSVPMGQAGEAAGHFAVPLQLRGRMVLVGSDGAELTAGREYSSIESIANGEVAPEEELFAARRLDDEQGRRVLLMDSRGNELSESVYDYLIQENGWIRYQQNGLQGAMDREGNDIIACQYTMLVPNGEGGYLAIDGVPYDDQPDGVYYVDVQGAQMPTGALVLSGLGEFSEGLCTATSAQSGRVGYLDAKGNWAISAQFEYGGLFRNGRAEVCIESGYGVIDAQGNWLLTPKYTFVSTGFGDGNIIIASQDDREVLMIDPRTYRTNVTFKGDPIYFRWYYDRNYVVLYRNDKVELVDEEGIVRMETGADGNFETHYQMGNRAIMRSGVWGEVNAYLVDADTGEELAGPYREMTLLMIDELGEPYFAFSDFEIIREEEADGYTEIFEVPYTRRGGLIDGDGQFVIPMGQFMELQAAGHGLLYARTLYDIGLVDLSGNWIACYSNEDPDLVEIRKLMGE